MSKAVLIIDMPKSCDECDFIDTQLHYCTIPWFGKDVSDYVVCRHEECPLKEMPEKQKHCLGYQSNNGIKTPQFD